MLKKTKNLILSLQHLVAMFGATVLVPLLVGIDPKLALFSAGMGTLVFHACTKWKVPVFLGSSFAFVAPLILVKEQMGDFAYAAGGVVVAGLTYMIFSFLIYKLGAKKMDKLFSPVVVGPMIVIIGMNLAPVAVDMAGKNWTLAIVTLSTIIAVSTLTKGFFSSLSVLIGMLTGYVTAIFMGEVDFSVISNDVQSLRPVGHESRVDFRYPLILVNGHRIPCRSSQACINRLR